jgi:sarcosine oxidase, subunit alpha
MSRRLEPISRPVTFELDGESIIAQQGEPVAAAFVAAGRSTLSRSIKYHRPRGPFCFSGGCAQCLVRVDGLPNQYACQVPAREGLRVERQNAFPDASIDVLQATDFVFSKWFNHHEFLAGVPVVEKVMLEVARKLAGLGLLPDQAAPSRVPALVEHVAIAIVGGGASGLSAARALTERGLDFTLFEREPQLGGRLLIGADDGAPAVVLPTRGALRTGAAVVGLFADDGPPCLAVVQRQRLHLVFFQRLLLANGGQPTLLTFPNNDLPGVFAARAVSRLIRQHRILPGARIAVVGEPDECRALAGLVTRAGGTAVAVGGSPVRAHGLRRVDAVTVSLAGRVDKVACDAIALCAPVSPSFELARAAGARVSWDARSRLFSVEADAQGRATPSTWVAGELRGPMSASASAEAGLVAANALAADVASKGSR